MNKNICYGIGLLFSLVATLFLAYNGLAMYAIFTVALVLISLYLLVMNLINSRDEDSIYESELKNILKTYDAVLINSENIPDLVGRNIIKVSSIEDLIIEKGKINPGTVDELGNGRALYHMMTFPKRVYVSGCT